jgi:WD40 repeat protein
LAALVAVSLIAATSVSVWMAIEAKVSSDDAEREVTRTKAANETNLRNLHLASMADYTSALKALEEDFAANTRGEPADGYGGKSRWHEAIALLVRALEREPGNHLASVRLYDALSSRLQEKRDWPLLMLKHTGAVQSACYSPDGSKLLTASHDHTARLWDAVAGTPIGEPMQHDDIVWSAGFSPDGARICTASADKTVRIWDAATGRALGEALRHEDQVRDAVFSPDGSKIVTASAPDGKSPGICRVRVWNLTTGHSIGEPMLHPNPVKTISFSPDGTKILTASHENGRGFAQLWDAESGKPIGARMLPHERVGGGAALQSAALNPDGSLILAACNYTARLWNPATGEAVGELMQHTGLISQAIFSPDGLTALTITMHDQTGTNKVQLWNARTGKALGDSMKSARLFSQAGFSPDGARIVTNALSSNLLSSSVQIWDAATGCLLGAPMQHASRVHRVIFSPDGRKIVTACADGCARVWEVHHGAVAGEPLRSQDQLFEAGFNSDGTITAFVAIPGGFPRLPVPGLRWEKKVNPVWDPFTGKALGGGKPAYADSLTPDGSKFISFGYPDSNKTVRIYDSSTRKAIGDPMEHDAGIQRAFLTSDGARIVSITSENSVCIWDAATCQSIGAMRHKDMVFVKLSPDGTRLVTQSRDGTAQLIDLKTGKALGEPIRHERLITTAFSPESSRLVTTGGDGTVQVWDARTGTRLGATKRHKDKVREADFRPDGGRFVTVSDDGTAQIWDARSGEAAGELLTLPVAPGATNPVKFSPAGTRMLIICADDTVRMWDMASRRPVGQPMRHPVRIFQADFSADGSTVLTVTPEAARLWEAETGRSLGEPMRLERQTVSRDGLAQAALRQDGKRIVTATQDHTIRVWRTRTIAEAEAIPAIDPAVIDWARNLAGLSFNEDGEIYVIPDEARVRAMVHTQLPPGPWSELKTWIETPLPDRKVCPKSGVTFRQLAARERDFNGDGNAESLDSALRYDCGISLARLFLAAALEKNVAPTKLQDADNMTASRAAFLRRCDLEALGKEEGRMNKEELAGLWMRAAKHLARLTPDKKAGIGAKATTVREEALKAAQKAVALAPQSTQAAQTLKDVQALSEKKSPD